MTSNITFKIITMAYRNVFRNWRRTLVTTLAMGFAGLIMILFACLMEGLLRGSERNAVSMDMGDIQIHAYGYRDDPDLYTRIESPEKIAAAVKNAGFYAAQRLYGFGLAASGSTSAGVQVRGVDIENESEVTLVHNHILEGSWLNRKDKNGVVLGRKLARTLGVKPGDELVFVGQATDGSMANDLYHVRGILKSIGEEVDRAGLYMVDDEFRFLFALDEGAHEIVVMRPDRNTDLDRAREVVSELAEGYETLDWRSIKPVIARILDMAGAQMIIMVSITYIAVAMIVLNAMLMSVLERIRELGIMKAIGVTPGQIMLMIYVETFVQITAAAVIAFVLGTSLSFWFQQNGIDLTSLAEGISFAGVAIDPVWRAQITGEALFIPLIFLFIIGLLAVLYPAIKAAVIKPVAAIHYR